MNRNTYHRGKIGRAFCGSEPEYHPDEQQAEISIRVNSRRTRKQ